MRLCLLVTALLLGTIAMVSPSDASQFDRYRWKNRILVVTGPSDDAAAQRQRQIYDAAVGGMSERSIILAEAIGDGERSRKIRSELGADKHRFRVFLIGKDGHTAFTSDEPISADDLFKRVDAMPMRQDEMRRAKSSGLR